MQLNILLGLFLMLLWISWHVIFRYSAEAKRIKASNDSLPSFFHTSVDKVLERQFIWAVPMWVISVGALIWIILAKIFG